MRRSTLLVAATAVLTPVVTASEPQFPEFLEFSEEQLEQRAAHRMLGDDQSVGGSEFALSDAGEGMWRRTEMAASGDAGAGGDDLGDLAKKSANPVSDVWLMWFQHDATQLRGDKTGGDRWLHSTKFQPVMSIPVLGGDWNLIVRPVFQFNSVPTREYPGLFPNDPWGRTTGMGDTILLTLLGPNRADGEIWGVGLSQIIPTAESDVLGGGKWGAGPAVLLARIAPTPGGGLIESSNYGFLAQHWWSYAGDGHRSSVNLTDIQYFFNYRINDTDMIGMTPNIRIDWSAPKLSDGITVPIGLGYSTVLQFGKLPVRIMAEAQYSVIAPDDAGSRWNFRLLFVPIFANPMK